MLGIRQKFLAGGTCEAAAAWKALSTTSVTRWLVSTLPPTTAASGVGARMDGVGMSILTGARHPCKGSVNWTLAVADIPAWCWHGPLQAHLER